jgi:hypothetical protein
MIARIEDCRYVWWCSDHQIATSPASIDMPAPAITGQSKPASGTYMSSPIEIMSSEMQTIVIA